MFLLPQIHPPNVLRGPSLDGRRCRDGPWACRLYPQSGRLGDNAGQTGSGKFDGHAGFTDLDAQFEQFSVDVGRAPKRVFATYPADQIADLTGNAGSTLPTMPDLPGPEEMKSLAVPGDRRREFNDVQC